MKVKVLIYGQLRDVTQTSCFEVEDVSNTDDVVERMNRSFPGLKKMKYLIAVEKEIVQDNTLLSDNFTVALLPPYSGG